MEYRSIADLNQTILNHLHVIPRDLDLIVGIPRSGLLPANILALHLNLPLTDLDGFLEGRVMQGGHRNGDHFERLSTEKKRNILIIDDSVQSGRQMQAVKQRVLGAVQTDNITYCAIYASEKGAQHVDRYFELLPDLRVFEWNLMHHSHLANSCVDIDGVLCDDPTPEENDDGLRYESFLRNARTRFIPTKPIGWLVTCRLEKYRALTEEWLAQYGVIYNELIMLDLPSKAARVAAGSHGQFKSEVYKATNAVLFIESSQWQAQEIADNTDRPVFCVDTRQMVQPTPPTRVEQQVDQLHIWLHRKPRSFVKKLRRYAAM